jgi:hypothetical protein
MSCSLISLVSPTLKQPEATAYVWFRNWPYQALGKRLGMFDERPQKTSAVYAISDTPMTKDEWVRRYVTPL